MLARQAVEVQRLADVRLDPVGELGIARRPAREPRLEILLGFLEIAPVIEPAQLLAAVVVGLPREIVERIAEEVDVAPALQGFLGHLIAREFSQEECRDGEARSGIGGGGSP